MMPWSSEDLLTTQASTAESSWTVVCSKSQPLVDNKEIMPKLPEICLFSIKVQYKLFHDTEIIFNPMSTSCCCLHLDHEAAATEVHRISPCAVEFWRLGYHRPYFSSREHCQGKCCSTLSNQQRVSDSHDFYFKVVLVAVYNSLMRSNYSTKRQPLINLKQSEIY